MRTLLIVFLLHILAVSGFAQTSPITSSTMGGTGNNLGGYGSQGPQNGLPQPNAPNYDSNTGGRIPNISGGQQANTGEQDQVFLTGPEEAQALPAWSQSAMSKPKEFALPPFGANLFRGNFSNTYYSGVNSDYVIMPGDRILIHIWGVKNYDNVQVVDQQGNIFLPEIGPIHVRGVKNSMLLPIIKQNVASVFTGSLNIYANLMNTQPVAVYVTGFVQRPGRYAGGPTESVLYYIDQAGGIDNIRGSYRDITVLRNNKPISHIDLYPFIIYGSMPQIRLKDGDVILVGEKKASVAAIGLIRQAARYEFIQEYITGKDLIDLVSPFPSVTNISISGTRDGLPYRKYVSYQDFKLKYVSDNDLIEFLADGRGETIMVTVEGTVGPSRYTLKVGTFLRDLLNYVPVDTKIAEMNGIYLRRRSVAVQQKKAINDALLRLEQSALTATSSSVDEATIRVREAELIQDFVKRASKVQTDGVVVVCRNGSVSEMLLEDGDIVIIPQKSNVVQISGEVMIPKSIVYSKSMSLKSYVEGAGGFSDRADDDNILVVKPNGEVAKAESTSIGPGDQILVMPKFDTKYMQVVKDISQILYQIAVATKVAFTL